MTCDSLWRNESAFGVCTWITTGGPRHAPASTGWPWRHTVPVVDTDAAGGLTTPPMASCGSRIGTWALEGIAALSRRKVRYQPAVGVQLTSVDIS
jgi:hypothetical protein